jgi:predicted dehydrogenase
MFGGPMSKTFKIGYIGAGGIAGSQIKHLKKYEGVEVVACSDVSDKSLAKMKTEHGIAKTYTDYKAMLRDEPELDAISVCTPNGLHAEHTIAALNAGKHVMVEKPMSMTVAEAKDMIACAKKSGKHLIIGFQWRFDPKTEVIRKQIEANEFGKILYVRCQSLRRRGIPNWGVFGRKDLQGGGPMIDIGVHIIEMAHYMIGSPKPLSVSGNTFTYLGNKADAQGTKSQWPNWDYKSYTVEDLAVGMVRFEGGALLNIEASFIAHIEKDVFNLQIMGEKGGANWDPVQIFKDDNGYMFNSTPAFTGWGDCFEMKMRHFVDVCRDGKPNMAPGEHGLMVQQMLNGLYSSAEQGKEVAVEGMQASGQR